MPNYEQLSKEELICKIKELEQQLESQNVIPSTYCGFKEKHSVEILDILPDMLSVFDKNYNYVALASSEATVHVGVSGDNLCGKNLTEILPLDAYKPVKENFDRVIHTGQPSIGYHNLNVDGEIENFENRVIPIDEDHILCICRNITDTVKAQRRLEMITSAVNNSLEEIFAAKTNGNLEFANKQFIKHHQLSSQIQNYKIFHILPGKTENEWKEVVNKIKENDNNNIQNFFQFDQGNQSYFREVSAFIVKDNTGEDIIWFISRDITERIEHEKKIHELNTLMETILNNIPVYLFVKDTGNDFRYLYWNKEFARVSRIPTEAVIGKTDEEIFPNAADAIKFRNDDLELVKNNRTVHFEEDYITATGEKRVVHTTKTLIPLENKAPLLIGIAWDITSMKQTESELIKARERAEESDKLKSAFLANMSHEIRTPLNAIVGFSKLLAEVDEEEERKQYAEIIDKNTELLLQLINDILDLSKIEAGTLEFKERPISLNDLCQGIYDIFLPRIPQDIQFIYQKQLPDVTTLTDGNRIAQILGNLLNNARKFTQSGEIRFGYQLQGNQIEFFVRDTGIGISPENQEKIFNRFIKLNNFAQGTGLGLSICRMILESIGGKINVFSVPEQGTEFRFTIPWKPIQEIKSFSSDSDKSISTRHEQQPTILIAEDVESNFLLLKTLLAKNYRLIHAINGKQAVEMYQQNQPDLVLMDIKMPEMDGLEATRLIRLFSQTVPIIALTAFAFDSDKEEALEAGCNDFLAKPLSAPLLFATLDKYISPIHNQ